METTTDLTEEVKPSTKVRAVAMLSRYGTRAQKRAVASGAATKRGLTRLGKGIKNQIVEPYTATKMVGCILLLGATFILQCYVAYIVALTVLLSTGSILLCFMGALTASFAYQLVVTNRVARAITRYAEGARYQQFSAGVAMTGDDIIATIVGNGFSMPDFSNGEVASLGFEQNPEFWRHYGQSMTDDIDDDLPETD